MPRLLALVLLACGTLLASGPAYAAGGDFLWQDQFDLAGGEDTGHAVATGDGRVVIVGSAQNSAGNSDFIVRAYQAEHGRLLWQDRLDITGGTERATAVVMDGQRVVVLGGGVDGSGGIRTIIRAYVAKTGALAWQEQSTGVAMRTLAIDGSRLVIAGTVDDGTGITRLIVRGYDAKIGALQWQDEALPNGYEHTALGRMTLHGETAVVAGTVRKAAPDFGPTCFVRAYDVVQGTPLWSSLHPTPCQAAAVASDGRRVIVVGQGQGSGGIDDLIIQSYDAATGEFLWQAKSGVSTGFDNGLIAVDVERRLAYAAGWIRWLPGQQNQEAFLVRAYDTDTGGLRWEDQFPGPDPLVDRCLCHASDLVVDKGRVFVVGVAVYALGHGPNTWLVRAYDAGRGDLLWSDDFSPAGGIAANPFATVAVALDQARLFVGGAGFNASGNADVILRAYGAK